MLGGSFSLCERLQAASFSLIVQQQVVGTCSRKRWLFQKEEAILVKAGSYSREERDRKQLYNRKKPFGVVCAGEGAELIWSAAAASPRSSNSNSNSSSNSLATRRASSVTKAEPPRAISVIQRIARAFRQIGAMSKARVYADVNVQRPKEYWDYEALTVQWGCAFNFACSIDFFLLVPLRWMECKMQCFVLHPRPLMTSLCSFCKASWQSAWDTTEAWY
jgi:hypothetical protein